MIPVDEVTLLEYAKSLLAQPPRQGYLTISNALQWRLQYQRVLTEHVEDIIILDPDSEVEGHDA
jgi:hypothetical protein